MRFSKARAYPRPSSRLYRSMPIAWGLNSSALTVEGIGAHVEATNLVVLSSAREAGHDEPQDTSAREGRLEDGRCPQ